MTQTALKQPEVCEPYYALVTDDELFRFTLDDLKDHLRHEYFWNICEDSPVNISMPEFGGDKVTFTCDSACGKVTDEEVTARVIQDWASNYGSSHALRTI